MGQAVVDVVVDQDALGRRQDARRVARQLGVEAGEQGFERKRQVDA